MNKRIIMMMCFCLVLSLVAAGCGGIGDKAIEKTIEKLIEAENKANEDKGAEPDPATPKEPGDSREVNPEGNQVKPDSKNKEIPKDYPGEFCPIYEPSAIVEVTEIRGAVTAYIIEFVSTHEMDMIENFYVELDNMTDTLRLGNVLSQIHLENKSAKLSGIINLEPLDRADLSGEDLASFTKEGYKTFATVMVDRW